MERVDVLRLIAPLWVWQHDAIEGMAPTASRRCAPASVPSANAAYAWAGGPRPRSALVPLTAIVVHVTRPGGRAEELLAAVAKQLDRGTQIPDERGHVRILLEECEGAAWQRVNDALDAAGDDWPEYLHVNPRPG